MSRLTATLTFSLFAISPAAPVWAQISSVDSGTSAAATAGWDEALLREWGNHEPWLRIRARPEPSDPKNSEIVAAEKAGLARLSGLGFKPIPVYRWSPESWSSGVRPGWGQRLPIDLREAYHRGSAYGEAYGSVVAGFEIENEPDISFVEDNAETYMAFFKAVYLGLKKGALSHKLKDESSELTTETDARVATIARPRLPLGRPADRQALRVRAWRKMHDHTAYRLPPSAKRSGAPLVVMAPLALPPGPYFEQLVANGLFSYTDAFNYHYYGQAEDFSGVYRQFHDAVMELGDPPSRSLRRTSDSDEAETYGLLLKAYSPIKRTLPVLLTEYGYGSLGDPDRDTVEGRVRQWAWFKSVGEQIHKLRIAGPMAFYLPPYFENKSLEFGLSVRGTDAALSDKQKALGSDPSSLEATQGAAEKLPATRSSFTAGNLSYQPTDFGLKKPEPWMEQIGRRFGENEATPALAWLYDYGRRHPYKPKDWTVHAPPASPVVIDFIAGVGLIQVKRYGGYLATKSPNSSDKQKATSNKPEKAVGVGPDAITNKQLPIANEPIPLKAGTGQLVLYNFSDETVHGSLRVTQGRELIADPDDLESERTLEPMCRIVLPVELDVPAETFAKKSLTVRFASYKPKAKSLKLESVFSISFYPAATWMSEIMLFDFGKAIRDPASHEASQGKAFSPTSTRNRELLESRRHATEEPKLEATAGRWRTTRGLEVNESTDGTWRFDVKQFPTEPNKSASAELPLPDDFVFPDGGMMRMNFRLVDPPGTDIKTGKYFELYFRTANGNLYQVWPRQYAMAAWQEYTEVKENYTMAFYGRANLPWRFKDNRPVALVFFFRPGTVPATYEIRDARIVRLEAP